MLLKDESKFNECVQPLQATMMPVQDPLLFLTMSSSFWGKFWDSLYKSEHAAVDATQPLHDPFTLHGATSAAANTMAYVSSNFQGGAVWYMIQGMLRDHVTLNRSTVSVFSTAPIDSKGMSVSVLQRLHALDVSNMRHTDTVAAIRRSRALVAIDINGFTEKPALQIFRFRVAAVQMTWMGCCPQQQHRFFLLNVAQVPRLAAFGEHGRAGDRRNRDARRARVGDEGEARAAVPDILPE